MSVRVKTFLAAALFASAQLAAVAAIAGEQEHGSEEDAQEMVRQAVDMLKTQGPQRAYDTFTNRPGSTFKDRDLFIVVYDFNGNCLSQGADPKLVGKNLMGVTDAEGKRITQGEIDVAKTKGAGWFGPYKVANPATKQVEMKKSYCKRAAGDTVVCAGVYAGG